MSYKVFSCSYCTNKYLSENIRDWHEQYQCNRKKIIWRLAFQTFDFSNIELPDVNEENSEEKVFQKPSLICPYCNKSHSRVYHLTVHMKSCKRRQSLNFKCTCKKKFSNKSNLTRHQKKCLLTPR